MKTIVAAAILSVALTLAGCSSGDDEDTPEETPVAELGGAEAPAADEAAPLADEAPPAEEAPAPADEVPAPDEAAPAADAGGAAPEPVAAVDPLENTLYLETACGRVTILMRPDLAPMHVERIKTLAREGFYDGQIFHRVIDGFMAQTGDPTGTGRGASTMPDLRAEFSDEPFDRGAVGMARGTSVNSANSQFFITFARADWLDGEYTLWGNVTDGMDCVDQLARGEPPANPDTMISLRVAADVE